MAVSHHLNIELIVVDDGSTDHTSQNASQVTNTRVIQLRKNCGQSTAIEVGIRMAHGDYVAMLDGDGQNNPNDIPNLLNFLNQSGAEMVVGWRISRKDTRMKRMSSRMAWQLRRVLLKDQIHDSGCTLKVMTMEVAKCLNAKGQLHRFLPALALLHGFKVAEMPVDHRSRKAGSTKYTWHRGINGVADMVLLWYRAKFKQRPIHLFGGTALIITTGGLVVAISTALNWNIIGDLSRALILITLGIQVFGIGILVDSIESTQEWNPLSYIKNIID